MGSEWQLEQGAHIIRQIVRIVEQAIEDEVIKEPPPGSSEFLRYQEDLAVIDHIGWFPIALLLSFVKSVEKIDTDNILGSIKVTKWHSLGSIYFVPLPVTTLPRIEFLSRGLTFEKAAEGYLVTAEWYINQLICQEIATGIQKNIIVINNMFEIYSIADNWMHKGKPLFSSILLGRAQEYYHKNAFHRRVFIEKTEILDKARVEVSIPWPSWEWDKFADLTVRRSQETSVQFSNLIPSLLSFSNSQDIPDFLGRAVHLSGETCFKALIENDQETFQKVFTNYFQGILKMAEEIKDRTKDMPSNLSLPAFIEPIIDLCELSGYTLLFSEFHQNMELWQVCKSLWNVYICDEQDESRVGYFAAMIQYHRGLFMITHRAILRTDWQIKASQIIRQLEQREALIPSKSRIPRFITIPRHPSLLVRTLYRTSESHLPSYHGLDIFVDLFLTSMPSAKNLDFGRSRDLIGMLERQKQLEQDLGEETVAEL
ncbi:hypothetical protein MASR1M31_25070 [Porphyromonadaceae bacterium]